MSSARHFAVIAPPTPGHFNPLIALGAALHALGHRVTVIHLAGAERFVRGAPVGFAPLGGARDRDDALEAYLHRLAHATGALGLRRMIRATAAISEMLLATLPNALAQVGADAVIADAAEGAGAIAATAAGLPYVASVTGLPLLHDPRLPPPYLGWSHRTDAWGRFRNWGGYLVSNRLLRPIRVVLERHPPPAAPLLHVAQCPEALDFPGRALPLDWHYGAPWRLPENAAADLTDDGLRDDGLRGDGRPLVFCSLGTLQGPRARVFAAMARACEQAGARAVIAHGGALTDAEAAALPGGAIARAWWPQRGVLARCEAAILHGGFNTVLDALAAGVPIVAAPIAFEQPATAARLRHHGAGVVVKRPSPDRLAQALRAVLSDPRYRDAADRIGRAMAPDGAAQAAARIDAALGGVPSTRATTLANPRPAGCKPAR